MTEGNFPKLGFLVKRTVVPKSACQKAVEYLFKGAPERMIYGKPETYTEFTEDETRMKSTHFGKKTEIMHWRHGHKWRDRRIRYEPWVWTEIINHPVIRGTVESLIGEVHEPNNEHAFGEHKGADLRGIYAILPGHPGGDAHVDRHSFHCGMVVLLDTVTSECGCFSIYPGTQHMFPDVKFELSKTDIQQFLKPFLFSGEAGDVIFWDSRLAHQEQPNTSENIRITLFHDWVKK